MKFKGILFDINGTLVDILTDESRDDIYRAISNFMRYQGIAIDADSLKKDYFARLQRQKKLSGEQYPEFDAVALWREFLQEQLPKGAKGRLGKTKLKNMPNFLAEMYRAASMYRLQLYPGVTEVLTSLADQYRLAALSDAQSAWAMPELRAVGLAVFFESVIVSGDLGYRKPDPRIFSLASYQMQLPMEDILFVGNDMYRDIYGAQVSGMKTVFFASNQGRTKYRDTEADYIIYSFAELPTAISFLENK
ncbi:HAD family hydrolase [Desulfogranum japonicum]|uniref:HAD family hydrolase n=1 Tax=Desulfogranum japonicum TaxID=231447 RepID=UPI000424E404|nr:HAD family hydrolase [Desulfogranum japonicum]